MKKVLFASTALAAMAIGGAASAQGITLFGDARLGLGYNIGNNGATLYEDDASDFNDIIQDVDGTDVTESVGTFEDSGDVRAVSRVRFGVRMSGETNSGITFGATIRADNAGGGQGGFDGQSAGSVFASGSWGTVTFGDTNGADEQHVGDLNGTGSVTGLGDFNETRFFTNGATLNDDADIAISESKRPTVRYDYNFAGFGLSASTDRDLEDIAIGGSYTFDFAGGSLTAGAGWADVAGGTADDVEADTSLGISNGLIIDDIEQWSVGIGGTFGDFNGKFIYTDAESGDTDFTTWGFGLGYTFAEWSVNGYYTTYQDASGGLSGFDGADSYGVGVAYDLGGGAVLAGGVAKVFGNDPYSFQGTFEEGIEDNAVFVSGRDDAVVADFGIRMSF
jgi:outer membrane protein OmpU